MYVFQMFDYYSVASFAMLWATLFESLVIGWIYGELKVLFCEGKGGGRGCTDICNTFCWIMSRLSSC